MTSREAFEAKWPTPKNCIWIGNGYAATEYNAWSAHTHAARWEGYQAAIQHACDVAAEIVLRELDDNGQARAINDAIKEALK